MVMLLTGIAIGAAFSKFWIMIYEIAKAKITTMMNSTPTKL